MSEVKMKATVLWTRLVTAMRADGLLAECITQCGPATAAVMVELVQEPGYEGTWLPMHVHPVNDRPVIVNTIGTDQIRVLLWDSREWCYADDRTGADVSNCRWTYIKLPENEQ